MLIHSEPNGLPLFVCAGFGLTFGGRGGPPLSPRISSLVAFAWVRDIVNVKGGRRSAEVGGLPSQPPERADGRTGPLRAAKGMRGAADNRQPVYRPPPALWKGEGTKVKGAHFDAPLRGSP
jgi:hypothetical protein